MRSRLYFKRATTEKDEEPDPDLRVLEVMKSNYGPVGETITLRWKNGLFLPVAGVSNLEKMAAEQAARHLFMSLLDQFNQQGRNNSAKPNAPNYAPMLFAKEKQARESGIRKTNFEAALRDLFEAKKIEKQTIWATVQGYVEIGGGGVDDPKRRHGRDRSAMPALQATSGSVVWGEGMNWDDVEAHASGKPPWEA